jgi:hypothetical protein
MREVTAILCKACLKKLKDFFLLESDDLTPSEKATLGAKVTVVTEMTTKMTIVITETTMEITEMNIEVDS